MTEKDKYQLILDELIEPIKGFVSALTKKSELLINKVKSVEDNKDSDEKYPSAKAVFNFLNATLQAKAEQTSNKVTEITEESTDEQYPSAKATYTGILKEKSRANNNFANAVKGVANGPVVRIDDVSPIEHTVKINVQGDIENTIVNRYGKNLFHINECNLETTEPWGAKRIGDIDIRTGKYVASCNFKQVGADKSEVALSIRNKDDVTQIIKTVKSTDVEGSLICPFDVSEDMNGISVFLYSNVTESYLSTECDFTHIQIEAGESATDFEVYKGKETYTPDENGDVTVKSVSPTMTLTTNNANVTLSCEYNKDLNKDIDKLSEELAKKPSGKAVAEAVSKALSGGFVVLSSPNGTKWSISVTNEGVVIATKITDFPTALESYTIFVPENVSDEWKVTGNYGELSMSTAEFLELFYDDFVTEQPVGVNVTKKPIGKDESGQYDMWEYDFCPANYSRTILLSSGMHAYELSASFGLANFIGNLYTDTENDAFSYIRNNVRIKVVPIVNPWGFNQYPKKYGNFNGVNPNRNFDIDGQWASYPSYTPTENEWNVKGSAPFSEAEVHNLARWAEENYNAEFWIDCHTGESYSDKDLWLYYSSDSAILDRINAGISSIETWFKDIYGSDCVTKREIDHPDMIRMHWSEKIAGIHGICLEQAPKRTTFGTSAMNEGADISNFSTNISTFVQEFLLEKYRNNNVIAITSVSANDIVISGDTPSVTVETAITPNNTTQNKFKWVSSDENVVAVYGCTNKAVVVRKGEGIATITVTNHEKPSVSTSFTVTVEKDETLTEIGAGIRAIDIATGLVTESTNRITTDLIPVTAGNYTITCDDGYYIKAFGYDANGIANGYFIGVNFNSNNISGTVPDGYIRILYKRSDNSDITEDTMQKVTSTINGVKYKLVKTTEEIQKTFNIGAGIRAVDFENNALTTSTNRVATDPMLILMYGVNNVNYTISVPTGYTFKGFICDVDGNIKGANYNTNGNFAQSVNIKSDFSTTDKCKYVRFVIKKNDESDITEEEMLAIKLTTSTGYTYQLVQTEEQ